MASVGQRPRHGGTARSGPHDDDIALQLLAVVERRGIDDPLAPSGLLRRWWVNGVAAAERLVELRVVEVHHLEGAGERADSESSAVGRFPGLEYSQTSAHRERVEARPGLRPRPRVEGVQERRVAVGERAGDRGHELFRPARGRVARGRKDAACWQGGCREGDQSGVAHVVPRAGSSES